MLARQPKSECRQRNLFPHAYDATAQPPHPQWGLSQASFTNKELSSSGLPFESCSLNADLECPLLARLCLSWIVVQRYRLANSLAQSTFRVWLFRGSCSHPIPLPQAWPRVSGETSGDSRLVNNGLLTGRDIFLGAITHLVACFLQKVRIYSSVPVDLKRLCDSFG